jgi:GT2 family glycosyltransferase
MEKKLQITIVIGTLNRPKIVLSLIKQLVEKSKKILFEVFVIDQSAPENYKELSDKFPKLSNFLLIHFDKPNTVKYLNYGWKNAKTPFVLYLDDDVTLTEDIIKSHIEAYKDSSINGVAGRVINDGEKISKGSMVGKIKWFGAEFTKNFTFQKKTFVDFPYGCNMSFRKNILKELNGFDENLYPPVYSFNEIDLGLRINKKWRNSIIFLPKALVYHHQYPRGGTRNDFEIKKVIESNNFNYGYFLGKNFNCFENIICFLRRLPYQLIKEPKAITQILKGFIYAKKT